MAKAAVWLFEIGYLFQHIATVSQIYKILRKNTCELVSLETNILFLIGAFSRICWMWDSMLKGFVLSYLEVIAAIASLGYLIFLYEQKKVRNYYSEEIQLPPYMKLYVLIPVVLFLSFFFNPGDRFFSSQFFVSLGIFSEAIGLIPQLYMIVKSKDTGALSELYIIFLAIARLFRLFFWIKMFMQGNKFLSLIIADVIHFLALFNFCYNVVKNWSGSGLPTFTEKNKKMF